MASFKEGFDTHDLKHARQVLEELREHAASRRKKYTMSRMRVLVCGSNYARTYITALAM